MPCFHVLARHHCGERLPRLASLSFYQALQCAASTCFYAAWHLGTVLLLLLLLHSLLQAMSTLLASSTALSLVAASATRRSSWRTVNPWALANHRDCCAASLLSGECSGVPVLLRRCGSARGTNGAHPTLPRTLATAPPRVVAVIPAVSGWSVRVGVVAPTAPDQRAALVDLYIATSADGGWGTGWQSYWDNSSSTSDPCDGFWYGVQCSGSLGSIDRNV
jgi:hypothetical protein